MLFYTIFWFDVWNLILYQTTYSLLKSLSKLKNFNFIFLSCLFWWRESLVETGRIVHCSLFSFYQCRLDKVGCSQRPPISRVRALKMALLMTWSQGPHRSWEVAAFSVILFLLIVSQFKIICSRHDGFQPSVNEQKQRKKNP